MSSNWGKPKKQAPPTVVPPQPERPKDAWDDDEANSAEAFPALGGGPASQHRQTNVAKAGWGASAKAAQQSRGAATLETVSKKAAPKAKAPVVPAAADFPSLGAAKANASAPGGWGAEARERAAVAAKAKLEPPKVEPPKEFKVESEAFPDLPLGASKPKAGARGSQAAKSKAKSKAKAAASLAAAVKASAELPPEPEEETPEVELVPDDQLVLIHDPLEAVARTEAAEAERRAKKVKKPGARKGGVLNPWIAGSSPKNAWKVGE